MGNVGLGGGSDLAEAIIARGVGDNLLIGGHARAPEHGRLRVGVRDTRQRQLLSDCNAAAWKLEIVERSLSKLVTSERGPRLHLHEFVLDDRTIVGHNAHCV